jgi:hypothetical protein
MLSRGGERHVRAFLLFRGTSQNFEIFPLFTTSQLLKKYYFVFVFFNVFFFFSFSDEDDAFFIAFALE